MSCQIHQPIRTRQKYALILAVMLCWPGLASAEAFRAWSSPATLMASEAQIMVEPLDGAERRSMEEADAALEFGDHDRALALYMPLAEKGDSHAQAMLAGIYSAGSGVPRNDAMALKWAQASADQNDPEGMLVLASLYFGGEAVSKDVPKAVTLVERGVEAGDAASQMQLGLLYAIGEGKPKDLAMARKWVLASARQGNLLAQITLGRLVLNEGSSLGFELPPPNVPSEAAVAPAVTQAVKQAAQQGDAKAQLAVGRALYLTALQQGTDVPEEALTWVERAAAQGDVMAMFAAGALHSDGWHGLPADAPAARKWFDRATALLPERPAS